MTEQDISKTRAELVRIYPNCRVIVTEDRQEILAEVREGFAIAVIERSIPHFHRKMREVYRVIRGTLYVTCGDQRHVLCEGGTITIGPGAIHFAQCAGEPAWIEVTSTPPWSADDHFVMNDCSSSKEAELPVMNYSNR